MDGNGPQHMCARILYRGMRKYFGRTPIVTGLYSIFYIYIQLQWGDIWIVCYSPELRRIRIWKVFFNKKKKKFITLLH